MGGGVEAERRAPGGRALDVDDIRHPMRRTLGRVVECVRGARVGDERDRIAAGPVLGGDAAAALGRGQVVALAGENEYRCQERTADRVATLLDSWF